MVSLVLRERLEITVPRVTVVPRDPLDLLEPLDLRVPLETPELRAHVVLLVPLVPLVSPVLLAELDLPAHLATTDPPDPQALVERKDRRVTVVRLAPPVVLVSSALPDPLAPRERRDSLVEMVPMDPLELPDLRVLVDSVVLLVCPDREASAVSPASPDNWESLASRDLVAPLVSVDLPDPWDPLDWLEHLASLVARELLVTRDLLVAMVLLDPRESVVSLVLPVLPVPPDPLAPLEPSALLESLVTVESL
ncbi:uncharacterized protein [Salvelinus sp. IW2-2015]|uniref:uncharacterized protein n=1 Tax=Salvelinus sp. IW2-2015 TaxID=2691554 RepID=UPI0038D4E8AA